MYLQVVVVHFNRIRPFAAHDLRQLAQLIPVAVGLDTEVNHMPPRSESASRLRKRQVERQPLAVESLDRTKINRSLRTVDPQATMRQSARNAAAGTDERGRVRPFEKRGASV